MPIVKASEIDLDTSSVCCLWLVYHTFHSAWLDSILHTLSSADWLHCGQDARAHPVACLTSVPRLNP